MRARAHLPERCGIVVIGRNEGARLGRALEAAVATGRPVVYVDSRSTDDSVVLAKECGADVVELDATVRLSAAVARNAGAARLLAEHPSIEFVQFIDGDCILEPDWVDRAVAALQAAPNVAAVCGWRRESEPSKNVFHRIAEIEWGLGGVGAVDAFGGDAMIRVDWFRRTGGYNPVVMAGEDPELSARIRGEGGTIVRLDAVSTWHDIRMSRLQQWWRRAERSGYGGALVAHLHRRSDRLYLPETQRALLWGAVAPLGALALIRWTRLPAAAVLAKYGLSVFRAARSARGSSLTALDRAAWGVSCVASAVPQALGALRYLREATLGRHPHLIEYK
jgi:GT2 family glycosyltransferase